MSSSHHRNRRSEASPPPSYRSDQHKRRSKSSPSPYRSDQQKRRSEASSPPPYRSDQQKRRSDASPPPPHRADQQKRRFDASPPPPDRDHGRRPTFPSYLDAGLDLPIKTRRLCEIIAVSPPAAIDRALSDSGAVPLSTDDVESVLKLSYSHPANAVSFFRWSSAIVAPAHSPYSWNLLIDLLGKNRLFDEMWDHAAAMLRHGLVSLATFASIFSSYATARLPGDALAAFWAAPRFGVRSDSATLNSLVSALCREGLTQRSRETIAALRGEVRPDADTFAIILEGCEMEGEVRVAQEAFDEMIANVGWDPANVPAYDTFLTTLANGGRLGEALRLLRSMAEKHCYPSKRFFKASLGEFVKLRDAEGALLNWGMLVGRNEIFPDTEMYELIISLQCEAGNVDAALKLFDEMGLFGAVPDGRIFNLLLQLLIKKQVLIDAKAIIKETLRNECFLTSANIMEAMKLFFSHDDWRSAVEIWRCVFDASDEGDLKILAEGANLFVERLREIDKLSEACKYAEDIIDRGIMLKNSTLSKLKSSLISVGQGKILEHILRKQKNL